MIDRYCLPEMRDLFSDRARLQRWLDVEMLVLEGWSLIGRVPPEVVERVRSNPPVMDDAFCAHVARREAQTRHDVVAFVDVLEEHFGPDGRWIHYGITSSDIVDTAGGVALAGATDMILRDGLGLFSELADQAREHTRTRMIGRTHGVHAEPITLGRKLALLALQVSRALEDLARTGLDIRAGKVSGAVGSHTTVDPRVEEHVCQHLDCVPTPSSQVVPRDLHAALGFALARLVTVVEAIALQVRLGHQTEVSEILEGFAKNQKGSSAMPHKRNPASAEQLCGIARIARALQPTLLENVALWHERDIAHSSVERVVLVDLCCLAHYAVNVGVDLIRNWHIDFGQMERNLAMSGDAVESQALLLHLIDEGASRGEAHRRLQEAVEAARVAGTSLASEARRAGLGIDDFSSQDALPPAAKHDPALLALDTCWATRRLT